jgi:hypothetical protein
VTEPHDDRKLADHTSIALHGLRLAVRERVPVPPSAQLRRRAERTDRLRYASALAAGATALLVLVVALQLSKPATGPIVGASPGTSQSQQPEPPSSPPPGTGPIPLNFDNATVDVAPNPDVPSCPSGAVHISGQDGQGSGDRRLMIYPDPTRFGDLTGDGRSEAVVTAGCFPPGGDQTEQLLVVSSRADGSLAGYWTGAVTRLRDSIVTGGPYLATWITDGVIYADYRPHTPGPSFVIGQVHAYQWDGKRFVERPQTRFPALLPTQGAAAPPVRLGPLATVLGCADGTARFGANGVAMVGASRYDTVQPPPVHGYTQPDPTQLYALRQWVVLSGRRVLLARVNCDAPGGRLGSAVAVLEPDGTGLTVIDAVPVGGATDRWQFDLGDGKLIVDLNGPDGARTGQLTWTWDGSHFKKSA